MEKGKITKWQPVDQLLERFTEALSEKLQKDNGGKDLSKVTMHPEDFMSHVYDFAEAAYLTVSNGL